MTILLLGTRRVVGASLMVLLAALVFSGGVVLLADDPLTSKDFLAARGGEVGQLRLSGSDEVALYINQIPVSVAEVLEERAEIETSVGMWASALERMVPDDHPSLNYEGTKTDYIEDQTSPVPEFFVADMVPWIELWQGHGPDTMALANLMDRYAFVSAAIEAGFSATDAEVRQVVDERRAAVEAAEVQPPPVTETFNEREGISIHVVEKTRDHKLDGYIAVVGEDAYWDTILPARERHNITMQKWWSDALADVESHEEMLTITEAMTEAAREEVVVEFTDEFPLDTSLEQVEEFIEGHNALKDAER